MFGNVISLEWKKQKISFLSAWGILALCALALTIRALLWPHGKSLGDMLDALLLGAIVCIPLYALLFGAMSGAGLRTEYRRSSEEVLPFTPVGRVAGAYVMSLICFAGISGVLILVGLSRNAIQLPHPGEIATFAGALPAGILVLHFLAFTFTYWWRQPLLGSGLAMVISGVCAFLWNAISSIQFVLWNTSAFMPLWLILGATTIVYAGALIYLSKKLDREVALGWKTIPLLFALGFPAFLLLGSLFWGTSNLQNSLQPSWLSYLRSIRMDQQNIPPFHGVLLQTESGSLVRVQAGGMRKVLFRGEDFNPMNTFPLSQQLQDGLMESDNLTAVLLAPTDYGSDIYEVRVAGQDGVLAPYSIFQSKEINPDVIDRQDGVFFLYGRSKDGIMKARLPEKGKPPQWKVTTLFEGQSFVAFNGVTADFYRRMLAEGKAATMTSGGTLLTQIAPDGQTMTWQLPGRAHEAGIPILPAFTDQNKPGFAVILDEGSSQRLVLCKPDGSVVDFWNRSWEGKDSLHQSPVTGGFRWMHGTWAHPEQLLILNANGKAFPAIEISDLVHQSGVQVTKYPGDYLKVNVRRIDGDMMWVILQDSLVVVDLPTGKITKKLGDFPAGDSWRFVSPMNSVEGIYFVDGKRIRLMDWNGKISDLGPARL